MKHRLNRILLAVIIIMTIFLIFEKRKGMRISHHNKQMKQLLKAENFFINKEYSQALSLYKTLDTLIFDDDFVNLRIRLAETNWETAQLMTDIEEILSICYGADYFDSLVFSDLAYGDLIAMLKNCYHNALQVKQSKSLKIEGLSRISYLRFTNERGNAIHYLGEVQDSMAQGEGVGIWDNESVYVGTWSQNKREGKGLFRTERGETYEGEYKQDRRNGHGVYQFRNGDFYSGNWLNGKRSGFGTVISAKGDTLVHGFWKDDRFDRRKTRDYFNN